MSVICNWYRQSLFTLSFKSNHRSRSTINRFLLVIHIGFMLISCNSSPQNNRKQVFRYNSSTGITSLDPSFARTQENIRAVNQLFNGLVQLDKHLNIKPGIAKSWSISDDSKVYTFNLRNDVLFHNHHVFKNVPRKVTAFDFVYSFRRIVDPKTASDGAWIFNGIIDKTNAFSAINDTIFQIRLIKPFTPLISLLTMAYCYVVPQEGVDYFGDEFGKNPIGTGPFRFANYAEGVRLNLIKNEEYFESTKNSQYPKIDAISISFIQSKQTELLEFTQKKLDVFTGLESSFKDEILNANGELTDKYSSSIDLKKVPFLNTEYLAFNTIKENSPVQDRLFRQAISLAVDRESMIKYLRNGVGTPANGGFTPIGLPAYQQFKEPAFNIGKAKKLLVKSNVKINKPLKLTTTKDYLDLCVLVQKNLADIGVPLKIDVVPSSLLKQQKSSGDLAFFRSSWIADYPDGENYMACFYSKNKAPNGPNYTLFSNPLFDELYESLLSESDEKKKKLLFQEMEEILKYESPFVLLFYDQSIWLHSKRTKNLNVNSLNHLDLREVEIN